MEVLGTLMSLRQARRLVDELAIQGGFDLARLEFVLDERGTRHDIPVYVKGGEELTVAKRDIRRWDVVKRHREGITAGST